MVIFAGPGGATAAILQEGDRIVVADFQSHTGDDHLAATVGEAFRIDLSQSDYFAPVTDPEIANALRRMEREAGDELTPEVAREIAIRDGYPATFEGQVDAAGSGWIFSVQLVAPITGQILISEREAVPDEGAVLAAIDLLSARVRERIGESLQSIEASAPLPEVTTSSLDALQAYARGVESFRGGESPEVTELHLKEAIARDSTFALAHRLLGTVYRNGTRWAPMIEHTTRAYELRDRLPPRERLRLIAAYHERVSGDLDAAATALQTLSDEFVEAGAFPRGLLSAVHMRNHRYAAAESVLVQIHQSESGLGSPGAHNIVSVNLSLGKIDEALALAEEVVPVTGLSPLARAYFVLGRWDEATAVMEDWAGPSPGPGRQAALADHGSLIALVQGRYGEFERLQQESLAMGVFGRDADFEGQRRLAAAQLTVLGDTALARQTADRAFEDFDDLIDESPGTQARIADFYAAAGDRNRSRELVRRFQESDQPLVAGGHRTVETAQARLLLYDGQTDAAIRSLQRTVMAPEAAYDCDNCDVIALAEAFDHIGTVDSATVRYEEALADRRIFGPFREIIALHRPRMHERLGQLYEELGDTAKAVEHHQAFVDLWQDADPELQPGVEAAREAIQRLSR
jgi:tetratricopeptide (TPR) repeat protein